MLLGLFFLRKVEQTAPTPIPPKAEVVAPAPPASAAVIHEKKTEAKKLPPKRRSVPVAAKSAPPPAPVATASDSTETENDTMPILSASTDCAANTLALWVYPEPSGGLHRGPITVAFQGNKPCSVFWRFEPDTAWREYDDAPISIEKTATLDFRATDRCGRAMETRQEYYEIEISRTATGCPQGMDLVKIGSTRFCVDRYEWPNRKGAVPLSYVSYYQAMDSCYTAGKRLCSSEEWSLACSGPFSWKYPYGQNYEHNACVTVDGSVQPSGSKSECRAYFGAFDMAGNLLEWTSTPAKENPQFYNVMGGFWESGSRSGCFDIRYSYFPQNRHNPVGFRCCKDVAPGQK